MIVYANDKELSIPITLITSFRTQEDTVFREELLHIQEENRDFKMVETLTQPTDVENWKGHTGRVNEDLLKDSIPDVYTPVYYISGPPAMVEGLSDIVTKLGVSGDHIKSEKFSGY